MPARDFHIVSDSSGVDVYVGLGFHNLKEEGSQTIKGSWIVHGWFDFDTLNRDIALIKLEKPADLSETVKTIKIISSGSDVAAVPERIS